MLVKNKKNIFLLGMSVMLLFILSAAVIHFIRKNIYTSSEQLLLSLEAYKDYNVIDVVDMNVQAPSSFFVTDDEAVYICDYVDSTINVYKSGEPVQEIEINIEYPVYFLDIYVANENEIYVLDELNTIYKIDSFGNVSEKLKIPEIDSNLFYAPDRIEFEDSKLTVTFSNNKKYFFENGVLTLIEKSTEDVYENDGPTIVNHISKKKIKIPSSGNILTSKVADERSDDDFVVEYFSVAEENGDDMTDRKLYFIKNDRIHSELDLKYSEYFRPHKSYMITEDDIVYQMFVTEDKLEIYRSIPHKFEGG